jgi:eukaryotic-like serine/threonine-protein kinase
MFDGNIPQTELLGGRYQVVKILAHGGSGVVYRALDTTLGWEVAVKVLHQRFPTESTAACQFIDAARIAGQLRHPGIPPVQDIAALSDGRPFFVMPLIRGATLQNVFDEGLDPIAERERLLAVLEQVCQVMGYAHFRGVAHGDLRPTHIMIGAFGEVQVLGWGAARIFRDSLPERTDGLAACLFDVFRLGEILYTVLTGDSEPVVPNVSEVVQRTARVYANRATERLDRCGADPHLVALVRECLRPNPADRPRDARAVADRIAELRRRVG